MVTEVMKRERRQTMHADVDNLVLRLGTVHDDGQLGRLAMMDGKAVGPGPHVVAEIDGIVVAAKPVNGGEPIADPFRPTAHLVPLLELRAGQLFPAVRGHLRPLRAALRAIHV
jgi:hypothetical protein